MSEAQPSQPRALAESLRDAVARTLEATARPAGPARERAAELVDEVVERIDDLSRRGQDVGGELARRGQGAGEAIAKRIGDLVERARPEQQGGGSGRPNPRAKG